MPCRSCKAADGDAARMYHKAADSRSALFLFDKDGKLSACDCVVAARDEAVAQSLGPSCYYRRRDAWRTRAFLGEERLCFETLRTLEQSICRELEARAEVQDSETNHISTF